MVKSLSHLNVKQKTTFDASIKERKSVNFAFFEQSQFYFGLQSKKSSIYLFKNSLPQQQHCADNQAGKHGEYEWSHWHYA